MSRTPSSLASLFPKECPSHDNSGDMRAWKFGRAEQDPSGQTMDEVNGWWHVDAFFNSKLTDICLLMLSPGNDAARRADERGGYLRWHLSPLSVEQRLYAFGLIKKKLKKKTRETQTDFKLRFTGSTQRVAVTSVFPNGRREQPLDMPAILGAQAAFDPSTAPSFEVRGEISPAMSGGPVFNSDLLYGVVSRGLTEQDEQGVKRDVAGIVVLLRPLLQMPEMSFDGRHVRIADLIDRGKIRWLP